MLENVRTSLGLPTDLVLDGVTPLGPLARAVEAAGVDAAFVTDHPAPDDAWLAGGGHRALDPMVALAVAAEATTTLRLHTNLYVAAYRHPWLVAHATATLDQLSGGRLILGVGAGYLEGEMAALGVALDGRNQRTDDTLALCRRAWAGETIDGRRLHPLPARAGGPPVWIGGNSRRAVRRAAELGDGWSPFPSPGAVAAATRTTAMAGLDDLAAGIALLDERAAAAGRATPIEVAYMVPALVMGRGREWSADEVLAQCADMAALGVGWLVLSLPSPDRDTWQAGLDRVRTELVPELSTLTPTERPTAPNSVG
ncbi:MAG TPA: TIGR03619 family F420-dependent LLM class oxidoreductase [Iamia sp.]|nr:TIGR03619 family F420-dependent LLM class oxidoreductase [Iamia sp.]